MIKGIIGVIFLILFIIGFFTLFVIAGLLMLNTLEESGFKTPKWFQRMKEDEDD